MTLVNPNILVSTTFSGKDIAAGTIPIYTYTHTSPAANCWALIEFWATVAGSGNYIVWLTKQWAGAGNVHDVVPHTTITLGATTDLCPNSILVQLFTGDVLNVMVDGQGGDTSVSGGIRITSLNPSVVEPGEEMDLVDAPNATAVLAIQSGLAVPGDAMDLIDDAMDAGALKTDAVTEITAGLLNATAADYNEPDTIGEAINTAGASAGATPATFWQYVGVGGRTLTMTAEEVEAAISGGTLNSYRDCTFVVSITGLGSVADREKLFFTVKKSLNDGDDKAIVQIEETDGLLYLNKAAIALPIDDEDGSLTVADEDDGDITIRIEAVAMAEMDLLTEMVYDVAIIEGDDDKRPLTNGIFNVFGTSTRTWDVTA